MNIFRSLPKPAWFLMVVTPIVIESCITWATPPDQWLMNPPLALLLILVYGSPILFLRELWVRRALPLRSIFLLGMIYGIFNEGIIAHTLTQVSGEPITHFLGYDEVFGIHWAWASMIVPWHAFFSVTFMILLTHLWFPNDACKPWLQHRVMYIMGVLNLLLLPLYFLINTEARPAPIQAFPIFLTVMAFIYWRAVRVRKLSTHPILPTTRALIITAVSAVLIPAIITIAGFELVHHKIPVVAYFGFTLSVTGLIFRRLGDIHPFSLLAFMLGGTVGLCGFAALVSNDPVYMVTAPLFVLFIFISMKKLLNATQQAASL